MKMPCPSWIEIHIQLMSVAESTENSPSVVASEQLALGQATGLCVPLSVSPTLLGNADKRVKLHFPLSF